MKKALLILLLIIGAAVPSIAQPPTYDDLLIYYADGDYEKLLKKAEAYTLSDKTKADALPYLYLAKANFDMSKDAIWLEDYPKAFADCINYAGTCIKKDKEGVVYQEHIKFFTDLKTALVEEIKNLVETGAYAKVIGAISKLHRIAKDDVGSYFLKAASEYNTGDKGTGKITAADAYARLGAVTSVEGWRPIDLEMLKLGIIEYSKTLIKLNQKPKAVELLGSVKQWLEKDEEFMAFYNEVVNGVTGG
jgi:hypothetical protein